MKKESTQESKALEEALSPIVNRLIDKNYEESQEKIALQMAPLIGGAIRKQIKSQKDDVVDALYPVIGNMISRYVTKTLEDMLEKINMQIQNGLSFTTLKRKFTAKIKGVSETELLLNEHASANIRALLLIHKETGIVLAHSENPNAPLNEPEMLASMMSAIRSFVNDWIAQNSEHKELGEIEYGGNKIIMEDGGYCYLAVIVEGSVYKVTYDKIRTTLEQIVLHHGESIKAFNGDLQQFANREIYKEIALLLDDDAPQVTKHKKHPLLFILPFLLVAWFGYSYYQSYTHDKVLMKVQEKFYKTPQLTSYNIDTKLDDAVLTLSGRIPFEYYKKLASQVAKSVSGVTKVVNNIVVVDAWKDPMQISTNIAYLLKGLNLSNRYNLQYSYDFTTLKIKGSLWSQKELQQLQKLLSEIQGVEHIEYNVAIVPPKLHRSVFFKKDSVQLTDEAKITLLQVANLLENVDKEKRIVLSAYSDCIGSKEHNRKLSEKRVQSVREFLVQNLQPRRGVLTQVYENAPEGIDATLEPSKARQVLITYKEEQ